MYPPDPIDFMSLVVNTLDRLYDDFIHLIFLYSHRETSDLVNELPEESDQFRFLRVTCLVNLNGSVVLMLDKVSTMWISIPLDLSSRSSIPLSRFIRSRRSTLLLAPSLVLFPPSICLVAHVWWNWLFTSVIVSQ